MFNIQPGDTVTSVDSNGAPGAVGVVLEIATEPRRFAPGTLWLFQQLWGHMVHVEYPAPDGPPHRVWMAPEFLRKAD